MPINSEINVEPATGVNAEPVEEPPQEGEPAPAPKKRGRPFGAKDKAKAKAPVARPRKKEPIVEETQGETESEKEIIVKKKRRRTTPEPAPQLPSTQDVALEVMQLLSNRHVDQAAQRRAKYASWFQ